MKLFHLWILIIASFSSTILTIFFPEDISREGGFYVLFAEVFILIIGTAIFFLYNRFIKKPFSRKLFLFILAICLATFSLCNFPCENFCPSDFLNTSSSIFDSYDKITLNNYNSSYHSADVMMNNTVLYKFKMSANLFEIQYLEKKGEDTMPESIENYPVWIKDGNVIYDRKTLQNKKIGNYFQFTDSINQKIISFEIGTNGLNEVKAFYTGGGSEVVDGVEKVKSGVIDQGNIRIIVSENNPEMEINTSYGRLMRLLLYLKK